MSTEQKPINYEADLDDLKKIPPSKIKITHKLKEAKPVVAPDYKQLVKDIATMKDQIKTLNEQLRRQRRTIEDQEERLEEQENNRDDRP